MEHTVFHLGVNQAQLHQAQIAIIPGAPERVEKIAQQLENPTFIASNREYTVYLCWIGDAAIVVCSTGIGGPSTSIAVEELAQLGIRTFLRVGTTGAIQPHIAVGDMVVTTASVRLDGASAHFAPLAFPAVADFEVMSAMKSAAQALSLPVHTGVTVSSDTFYPGQERYDTYSGRVLPQLRGSMQQWQDLGALNFEMESATLLTMCATMGLKAGCIAGVILNRSEKAERPVEQAEQQAIEQKSIEAVVAAAKNLLKYQL